MNNYFVFLLIFNLFAIIGCSTTDVDISDRQLDYRNKSFTDKKHAGSTCTSGCIWSTYAVSRSVQVATATCHSGMCACVKDGDIFTSCEETNNFNTTETPTTPIASAPTGEIPYYNQYDNVNYGYATCQNTSVAMVLSHYEYSIHPDTIFNEWGKDIAQSPSGLNMVYRHYARNSDIQTFTNASPEELQSALQQGYTAIVHGYFTRSGHVIVVHGFDGQRYYVNDPAGQWDGCFKCGYNGSYNGVTSYDKNAFEAAVFTSNGSSYLPGWIHLIR